VKDDLTLLELQVLVDIVMERDPYPKTGGSRRTTQAIGRLRRKGLVESSVVDGELRILPTSAGRKIVPLDPRTA
jgi:hypothetical protein